VTDAAAPAPVKIRPEIASLPPYKQGKPAGADAFKLSSNENPFPPLPSVVAALQAETTINRYPDATAARLRARIAERYDTTPDGVHIASGSVAIIAQLLLAVAAPGDEVIYAWRSFEAYPGLALVAGARSVQVPLTDDFRHDLPAMAAAVTDRTRVIIVCSPNNPTGGVLTHAEVEEFLAAVPDDVLVILDEAYAEFVTSPDSVNGRTKGFLAAHPNVIMLRTFSKAYGLAGLRVGYAVGHPRVLDAARSTAIPLSVTAQAESAALASLDAEDELLERVAALVERRDRLVDGIRATGWTVPDTEANFLWLPAGQATLAVAELFSEGGIITRPFAGEGVRISVGEEEAIERIVALAARALPLLAD